MPEVIDDAVETGQSNAMDGVAYGLATGLGRAVLGPLGHAAGGVASGGYVGGSKGDTLATVAIGEGTAMLINGAMTASGGGGGGGGRRRM